MQIIAGVVEHRISDQFASQTFLVNMLSFVSRTINSYWGTQVKYIFLFYLVWAFDNF
jgi:hypothetical protein